LRRATRLSGEKRVQVVVFKSGEERLRQDMAMLHVLSVLERVWQDAALGVELTTYGCVATGNDSGFVEVVTPAATLAGIVAQGGGVSAAPLVKWLTAAARTGRVAYSDVVAAFASSCAAQCCATYLLGIGTRNGDAVMVRQSGHMFHVDFGSILGHAPSGSWSAVARWRRWRWLERQQARGAGGSDRQLAAAMRIDCDATRRRLC
jgi:phosphatidylinositol-4,5-bisphosphate 3-kinase